MHSMYPPQRGNRVKHHVLQVDSEVECHHRYQQCSPGTDRQIVEQTPATLFSQERQTRRPLVSRILRSPVFSATIAKLLGQRWIRACDRERRGATVSHSTIAARTAMNAASRIMGSCITVIELIPLFN